MCLASYVTILFFFLASPSHDFMMATYSTTTMSSMRAAVRPLASARKLHIWRSTHHAASRSHICKSIAHPRLFSASPARCYKHEPTTLADRRYFKLADKTLSDILTELEREADTNEILEDVEYSDGVMNVTVAGLGTYVLNRQPPSKQVWLSSPLSGPKRFDYVDGTGWIYRDGTQLKALLDEEWTAAGLKLDLNGLGLRED